VEALSAASAKPTPAYTPIDPSVAVFPLAIPTLAGPGTLSTVIMVMGKAEDFDEKLIVMGVVVLVLAICLLCYLASHPIQVRRFSHHAFSFQRVYSMGGLVY
jgi:small neutral amino acid transporter SnatA (MarC family)